MNDGVESGPRVGDPPSPELRLAYFAGDATNPTVRLRIRSFLRHGVDVIGVTFRREKFQKHFVPFWDNIALGRTRDRFYIQRVVAIVRGLTIIWFNRARFRGVEVLYARLLDAALLALATRWLLRLDAKLVYEIEDIQAVFFKNSLSARVMRFLERQVLNNATLVVVPSPGFVDGYLKPHQRFAGPLFLLENRIQLDEIPSKSAAPSPRAERWRHTRDRWVIGWFGTLRCVKSMRLLSQIADRLGDRVLIYTRGYPTETGLETYMGFVNRHPNWVYEGEYTMPEDLEDLYGRVHFVWCLDFLDENGNSELLLACRMYHGGYFGAVPIFTRQSQMARHLAPHGIGHAVSDPYVEDLCTLIENMTWDKYVAEREAVLTLRDDLFLEDGSSITALLGAISRTPHNRRRPAAAVSEEATS